MRQVLCLILVVALLEGCVTTKLPAPVSITNSIASIIPPGADISGDIIITNSIVSKTIVQPSRPTNYMMEAYFPPYAGTNILIAFFDIKTNLTMTNWIRVSLPYPNSGGYLQVPITNWPGMFRAGYSY